MIISVSRQKGAEGRESIKLAGNGKRSQGGGLAGWLAGYGEASSEQYCSAQSSLCPAATSCLLVSDRSLRPQVCVTDEVEPMHGDEGNGEDAAAVRAGGRAGLSAIWRCA